MINPPFFPVKYYNRPYHNILLRFATEITESIIFYDFRWNTMRRLQKLQEIRMKNVKVYFEVVWKESLKLISLNINCSRLFILCKFICSFISRMQNDFLHFQPWVLGDLGLYSRKQLGSESRYYLLDLL